MLFLKSVAEQTQQLNLLTIDLFQACRKRTARIPTSWETQDNRKDSNRLTTQRRVKWASNRTSWCHRSPKHSHHRTTEIIHLATMLAWKTLRKISSLQSQRGTKTHQVSNGSVDFSHSNITMYQKRWRISSNTQDINKTSVAWARTRILLITEIQTCGTHRLRQRSNSKINGETDNHSLKEIRTLEENRIPIKEVG